MRTNTLVPLLLLMATVGASAVSDSLLRKPDSWFGEEEGRKAVANVLAWQADSGSWPKNQDNAAKAPPPDHREPTGTFDNGATFNELRFLARAFNATGDAKCRAAFLKGYDHILTAQYSNGGWPQYHPPGNGYARHITFNDDVMVGILHLLNETITLGDYSFIDLRRREVAAKAFARGIDCIVRCQVVRDGKPTVWCAQHDEKSLKPAGARSYELPSLSGYESAGILRLLMSLPDPSPEVIRAVRGGVEWYEKSKVTGIWIDPSDGDRRAVEHPSAPVLWARFYDLETNRPFFCDHDGAKKWDFNKIGSERRNGYSWYGTWGDYVLKEYAKWPHR